MSIHRDGWGDLAEAIILKAVQDYRHTIKRLRAKPKNKGLQEQKTEIDENTLMDIAQLTGGKYFRATSNSSLQNVYDEINQLEKSDVKSSKLYNYEEYFRIFLWIALGLLLLDALLRWVIFKILN